MQVAGVILAAGRSQRMGRTKALLPLAGRTFLASIVGLARSAGLRPLRVVVGGGDENGIVEAHPELGEQDLGQLHSLRLALRTLDPTPDAVVVFLVDHPLVRLDTVRSLIDEHRASRRPIVIPSHRGRRGHPVLFAREVFPELLDGPLEGGARRVVRRDAARVAVVEVADAGVLADIDTPSDFQELVDDERSG